MDHIKLTDGTQVTIEDGASLDRIVHIAKTDADAVAVCAAVTAANLAHVEFCTEEDEAYGVYDGLILDRAPTRQTNADGTITVTISVHEPSALELRVAALEESQIVQDGAIEDLGMAVSDLVEA